MNDTTQPIVEVERLVVDFDLPSGPVRAVDDLSFAIAPGEILGIVGESGSGKSVTSRAIMRMLRAPGRVVSGEVRLRGRDVMAHTEREMERVRGQEIAMIFQDPQAALNPVMRIGDQIVEALRVHGVPKTEAQRRARELIGQVGIPRPEESFEKFPHQFSGGMRQRVVIAIALANKPTLLIADEPTTALDVTIQAQILELLKDLRDELGIAILFITHDMGVVAQMCDRIVVMNHGKAVETGDVRSILRAPQHDYTKALMAAVPRMDAPLRAAPAGAAPVLEVRDLRTDVGSPGGLLRRGTSFFAVDGVSFTVSPGETLGVVGESGCGKSTLSRTIVGIQEPTSGTILVDGHDVTAMGADARRRTASTVQYVFQDPFSSLNPRRTAGQSLEEALRVAGAPPEDVRDRAAELLARVELGPEYLDRYPYAFSGGQRQRIGIARALASDPRAVILDEPVSALDVSIQAQIIDLLVALQEQSGIAYVFISHDLSVVRQISHRVAVMNAGRFVETGTTEQVFSAPAHPYTEQLLAATPDVEAVFG